MSHNEKDSTPSNMAFFNVAFYSLGMTNEQKIEVISLRMSDFFLGWKAQGLPLANVVCPETHFFNSIMSFSITCVLLVGFNLDLNAYLNLLKKKEEKKKKHCLSNTLTKCLRMRI